MFICNIWVYSPGCHSAAFTAWIAFTQQAISVVADFASLSNTLAAGLASYTRPLFKVSYVFAAEVIPYQEQWKRDTKVESYNMIVVVARKHTKEPHIKRLQAFLLTLQWSCMSHANKTSFSAYMFTSLLWCCFHAHTFLHTTVLLYITLLWFLHVIMVPLCPDEQCWPGGGNKERPQLVQWQQLSQLHSQSLEKWRTQTNSRQGYCRREKKSY